LYLGDIPGVWDLERLPDIYGIRRWLTDQLLVGRWIFIEISIL
jgi:hypothetical protein